MGMTPHEGPRRNTGSIRFPDGSSIVRPGELDWAPWALPGSSFKLLSVNRRLGAWSCLVRFDAGAKVPGQRYFGDGFVYVMRGSYVSGDNIIQAGQFSVEAGSAVHERTVGPDGLLAYMMFLGGFMEADAAGRAVGEIIDAEWIYQAAAAHGAADHIPPPPRKRAKPAPVVA